MPRKSTIPAPNLIGMYGHTFEGDDIEYQFKIVRFGLPGTVVVQLYDFIVGSPGKCIILSADELKACAFYETQEAWIAATEKSHRQWERKHAAAMKEEADEAKQRALGEMVTKAETELGMFDFG